MKIIVNKGFDNILSNLIVIKNGKERVVFTIGKDFCDVNVGADDKIVVALRSWDSLVMNIASFSGEPKSETLYVGPSGLCRWWEIMNFKILPYLCIFIFALIPAIDSGAYKWVCAGMTALTAFSLIAMQILKYNSSISGKLFSARWI